MEIDFSNEDILPAIAKCRNKTKMKTNNREIIQNFARMRTELTEYIMKSQLVMM